MSGPYQQQQQYEEARKSLLDVVLEDYNQGKDARASRVFLVAEIDGNATEQIEGFFEEFVTTREKEKDNGSITGMLVTLNQVACAAIVEASTKVLLTLVSALHELSKDTGAVARNLRVCYLSEEVLREFSSWNCRSLRTLSDPDYGTGNVLKSTFDCYKGFIELAREMKTAPSAAKARELFHSQKTQVLNRLPTAEQLLTFARSEELCSLSEYLDIYTSHIDNCLDSERIWPAEELLKY